MPRRAQSDVWLTLIGVFKLLKALALLLVASGALQALRHGVWRPVYELLMVLPVDRDGRVARWLSGRVAALTPHELVLVSVGATVYAALFLVEAVGLLLRKRWGEIVTVVITASFIPLEIYEVVRGASPLKLAVIAVNLAVVGYLVWRLRRTRAGRAARTRLR